MRDATKLGRIEIAPTVIAALVAEAVKECYGVVGMGSRNFLDDLATSLALRGGGQRGIDICLDDDDDGADSSGRGPGVIVDIYVIIEYGTRISEVASGVMRRVCFTLESKLGIPVKAVNVHVQGLRVSEERPASNEDLS